MNTDNNTLKLIASVLEGIQDKKGTGIKVIDLTGISGASTEHLVICTAKNPTQVAAIADNIEQTVRGKADLKPISIHGLRNSQWVIVDYGHVMVHVFLPDTRTYYDLEGLWSDAPVEEVPDID